MKSINNHWNFFLDQYYEKYDDFREAVGGFFGNIDEFGDELETLQTNEFYLLDAGQT